MLKVAVLQANQGDSQKQTLGGLRELTKLVERSSGKNFLEIKVFVTGGVEERKINSQIESIRMYEPDALLSFGSACSLAAKEFSLEIGVAHLFLGVSDPVRLGLVDCLNQPTIGSTGILCQMPPEELPLQALLKLRPDVKRMVLMYREDADNGRIAFEASKMAAYIRAARRETILIPIQEDSDVATILGTKLQQGDGVIIPRVSVHPLDLEKIDKACKEVGAFMFASSDGIMPESAICGYSADLEFMGYQAAQYLYEILINKKPISELPVIVFDNPSRLVVSKTAMVRHGVTLPPKDFCFDFEGYKPYHFTLRHFYSFVAPHMSLLEMRLHKELAEAGLHVEDGAEYKPVLQEGRCYDEEFTAEQAIYILEEEHPFAMTFGTRMASRLQHAMVKSGIFKPMILIAYDDDEDSKLLSETTPEWPAHAYLCKVIIPTVDQRVFPDIVSLLQPHTKKIGCVYSFCADNLPEHISRRLGEVQEHCSKRGLMFVHGGDSRSNDSFNMVCKDIIEKTDSLFTLPDCVRNSDLAYAAANCHRSNTFVLGGDGDNFHMVSGILTMDYSKLVPRILELVIDMGWDREPVEKEIRLATGDLYYFYLNEPWLRTHGIVLPDNIHQIFGINVLRDPYNDDNFHPPGKNQREINKRMERPRLVDEKEYEGPFSRLGKFLLQG